MILNLVQEDALKKLAEHGARTYFTRYEVISAGACGRASKGVAKALIRKGFLRQEFEGNYFTKVLITDLGIAYLEELKVSR